MEHVAQLRRQADEFARLKTRMVVVGFEGRTAADTWRAQHAPDLRMLLDPTYQLYLAYGMRRSLTGRWRPRTLWHYARALLRGEKLPASRGDKVQMGGNVIVDSRGLLRLVHASKEPVDRPSVDELLAVLLG